MFLPGINWNKWDHYKDLPRIECIEPTPLALDNFWRFGPNSAKSLVVIENAIGYSFSYKSLTRRSGRIMQNVSFSVCSRYLYHFHSIFQPIRFSVKNNILHFLTKDIMYVIWICSLKQSQLPLHISLKFKGKKTKVIECQTARFIELNSMKIYKVILIKVWVVYVEFIERISLPLFSHRSCIGSYLDFTSQRHFMIVGKSWLGRHVAPSRWLQSGLPLGHTSFSAVKKYPRPCQSFWRLSMLQCTCMRV